jgi:anti-sigma factor RsiW
MSKCQDLELLLTEYVDGGAPSDQRASIAMHLERCPPCRERVAEELAARELLVARRGRLRACASDQLRAKCAAHRAAARPEPGVRRPMFRRTWIPLSLAATLVLAVAGAFVFGLNNKVEALATQVTLDHVKCFKLSGDPTPAESDPKIAGREWARAQGWSLRVPADSADIGLQLMCVRRCFLSEGRTAHLMYKWRGEPLSVFVLPRTIGSTDGARALVEKFGHEATIWSEEGRTYVVLARGRPSDLEPVVSYVRANAR